MAGKWREMDEKWWEMDEKWREMDEKWREMWKIKCWEIMVGKFGRKIVGN